MICKKCNEEIYNYTICPFCNHNQEDPVLEFQEEAVSDEPQEKSCETCHKTYSSYDKECQLCEVTKAKLLEIQQQDEEKYNKMQITKSKTIKLSIFTLLLILVVIVILAFSLSYMITEYSVEKVEDVKIEQLQYFEDETGQASDNLLQPINLEIAKSFVESINNTYIDLQIQFYELKHAVKLYNDYHNANLLQSNCKVINKEIKNIYTDFDILETHGDPLLENIKKYTFEKLVKPYYLYINQVSSAAIKVDNTNMNNATLDVEKRIPIILKANAYLICEKGNMSEKEIEEFLLIQAKKQKTSLQKYYDIFTELEKKNFDNLTNPN